MSDDERDRVRAEATAEWRELLLNAGARDEAKVDRAAEETLAAVDSYVEALGQLRRDDPQVYRLVLAWEETCQRRFAAARRHPWFFGRARARRALAFFERGPRV